MPSFVPVEGLVKPGESGCGEVVLVESKRPGGEGAGLKEGIGGTEGDEDVSAGEEEPNVRGSASE